MKKNQAEATTLFAGYSRQDITPDFPVQIASFCASRISTNVLDPVYATCVAISDGEDTILLFGVDVVNLKGSVPAEMRRLVVEATGVKEENILINSTHSHSAPSRSNAEWRALLYDKTVEAAKGALADLDAATVKVGKTKTDRLNFVRRYYTNEGGFRTDQKYCTSASKVCVAHETPTDEEMRIVYLERANKKDIVIVNWQCHPHRTAGYTKTDISADIIGSFRAETEKAVDVNFLYLQGGAGNVNPFSRIKGETRLSDYWDIGKALTDTLIPALDHLTPAAAGKVKADRKLVAGKVNHETDVYVDIARDIRALSKEEKRDEADELAHSRGLTSRHAAGGIILRAGLPPTEDFYVNGYSFGDVAISTAPFEIFDSVEKYVRDHSPFPFTLSCGYSNDSFGYLPSSFAFGNVGYEALICHFVRGTAEQVADAQLDVLRELNED